MIETDRYAGVAAAARVASEVPGAMFRALFSVNRPSYPTSFMTLLSIRSETDLRARVDKYRTHLRVQLTNLGRDPADALARFDQMAGEIRNVRVIIAAGESL